MVIQTVSMQRAYGLQSGPSRGLIAAPHEMQRLEGLAQYYGPPPIYGRDLACPGYGFHNLVMKNRYDAAVQEAMQQEQFMASQRERRRLAAELNSHRPVQRYGCSSCFSRLADDSCNKDEASTISLDLSRVHPAYWLIGGSIALLLLFFAVKGIVDSILC